MANLLVGEPIGWAMARVATVLFRPFAWRKWAAIAGASWLAYVHETNAISGGPWLLFNQFVLPRFSLSTMLDYVGTHVGVLMAWMIAAAFLLFGLYLLFRWVNCRGRFMVLDAVVNNAIAVKESWRNHRSLGNSLLWFWIKWDLALFNLYLAVFVVAAALLWPDFRPMLSGAEYRVSSWTWSAVTVGGAGFVLVTLFVVMAQMFFSHLLVPVMYVRQMPAGEAFHHVRQAMLWPNLMACIRYLLMMLVVELVQGAAAQLALLVVVLLTCLIGGALLYVPILSLVPLYLAIGVALPVEVFMRAYSLRFIEQFGMGYQVKWLTAAPRGGFEVIPG